MKRINYVIVFAFVFVMTINLAQATETRSAFKNYEITLIQDFHMGKHVQAVWTLNYDNNNEATITVVKTKTKDGIEYRVQSEYFSVNYVATPEGFGAKEAKYSWSSVPKKINRAVISRHELTNQKVITCGEMNDEKALRLIAGYLPDLVNSGYTHLLN